MELFPAPITHTPPESCVRRHWCMVDQFEGDGKEFASAETVEKIRRVIFEADCSVSISTLVRKLGYSKLTIRRATEELIDDGEIGLLVGKNRTHFFFKAEKVTP